MLNFYKTINNRITEVEELTEGCWISAVSPTKGEVAFLVAELKIDPGFVNAALDEEESSRIEKEDNQTLVIVDTPFATTEQLEKTILYSTMPLGIIITDKYIITVSSKENAVISEIADGLVRNAQTHLKTRFLLMILLRVAVRYLQHLKQIDRISDTMQNALHKSMKNKELIQLLGLEKSLVYFSTSLKANEVTLEKILRGRIIKLYEEDEDLLEDVLIEVKQAIEMSNIYSNILSGTMDAFASIISNNLNIVMKILTALTIIMQIPTMIASFYGMNVAGLPLSQFWWFPLVISTVISVIITIILIKKNMFS